MSDWEYDIEGNAVVWDFREWVDPDREAVVEVMETFEEVSSRDAVTASVTLLAEEGAIDRETFETIDRYLDVYDRNDVNRVAFVSPDIKGLALKGQIKDVQGLEVETFEEPGPAKGWALE